MIHPLSQLRSYASSPEPTYALHHHHKTSSFTNLTTLNASPDRICDELISDIWKSLNFNQRPSNETRLILSYSQQLSQQGSRAHEYLGYICFLSEYDYPQLVKCAKNNVKHSLQNHFDKALLEIFKPIVDIEAAHKRVSLQDPQTVSFTLLPRKIAKAIISGPNICNVGILNRIKEIFDGAYPFHKHLQYVLTSLQHQIGLRSKIRLIEKPRSQMSSVNDLIRVTCGLPPHIEVTAWEAQKTALSALLTDLTQGRVGSCFSTYLAINQLNGNLSKSLDDFHELLAFSSLTKKINGKQISYPVTIESSYHYRDKTVLVTREGQLENGAYIWESPGLVEACLVAGLNNPKECLLRSIQQVYRDTPESCILPINPAILLKETVPSKALNVALMTFESQTNHLLLRTWETTIANMAESDEQCYATHLFQKSVLNAISKVNDEENFHDELTRKIRERTRFLYETGQKRRLLVDTDSGYYGTFVLFDTIGEINSTRWSRIDSAALVVNFITNIIRSCSLETEMKERIISFVAAPDFIKEVLESFREMSPDSELSTPWLNSVGNDPLTVYKNYCELNEPPNVVVVESVNAENLLMGMIEMMRANETRLKKHFQSQVAFNIPLFISETHACRGELRSPFLLLALGDRGNVYDWLNKQIYDPCEDICHKRMTSQMQNTFASFSVVVEELPPNLTLVEFRNAMIDRISDIDVLKLDWFIFNNILTEAERQKLLTYSIPFIHSNWSESGYHIHMGFIVNPGTGKIELWKICSNGKSAVPVDQERWTKDKDYVFLF